MMIGNSIMERNLKRIWAIISCALVVIGCAREKEDIIGEGEITFTAGWEGEETRTVLQEDGTSVWWTTEESVNIFYGNQFEGKFTSTNSAPAALAQFRGTLTAMTGTVETMADVANAYWAVYPYDSENTCDGTGVELTVPDFQSAAEGSFADNFFPAIARSDGLNLAFYHVCGGIRFSVVSEGVQSVTVKGNNEEKLAGRVKVTIDEDGHPVVAAVLDGKTDVTASAPGGGAFEVGKYYFIALLPQTLANGFTMNFTNSSVTKSVSKTTSVTVNRSRFGIVNGLDDGLFNDIVTIILESPGTLGAKIDEIFTSRNDPMGLRIIGEMNSEDVKVLGRLNGLWYLDIREAMVPSSFSISYHRVLKYLYLPDSLTGIADSAFRSCEELLYVSGAFVETIGKYAFDGCTKLEDCFFPETRSLGAYCFDRCFALKKLIFPKVTEIGGSAFYLCSSVEEVSLDSIEELTSQQLNGRSGPDQIERLNLPSLKIIHNDEFSSQKKLKRLYLPSVTSVGRLILRSSPVEELILPALETVSESAFYESESLRRVELPAAVTIEKDAFAFCRKLTDVIAPNAVSLGKRSFGTCDLSGELDFSSVTTIGDSCFSESTGIGSTQTACFPELTVIGDFAFQSSPNTVYLDIPKAETIGVHAFNGCSNLVRLSEGNVLPTVSLGDNAFYSCSSLQVLVFPDLTDLGFSCFDYSGLTTLRFDVLNWKKSDNGNDWPDPPFEFWVFPIRSSNAEHIDLYLGISPFPCIVDKYHPWWTETVDHVIKFMGCKWASVNDIE